MAKKKYETAADLRAAVDEYFAETEGKGEFPDYAGMLIYLGIGDKTAKRYCADNEDYAEIFEETKLRRESFLVRRMTKDNKLAQGCLNALKQEANGGYTDKPVDNGERKLVIEMRGIGDNAYK